MAEVNQTTASDRLAQALEALAERAFSRCLFPDEVKEAFAALDAWHGPPAGLSDRRPR